MKTSVFWATGLAFFAVQLAILVALLRGRHARRGADTTAVEIVWTLVPAAVLAALVLMTSGLTTPSWSRARGSVGPLASRRVAPEAPLSAIPPALAERR